MMVSLDHAKVVKDRIVTTRALGLLISAMGSHMVWNTWPIFCQLTSGDASKYLKGLTTTAKTGKGKDKWSSGVDKNRGDDQNYKCKASKGDKSVRSESNVGCSRTRVKEKSEESEWEKQNLIVFFSNGAAAKHVKSSTTKVSQTWCGHRAEQREESWNAYMLSSISKPLLKYLSRCLSTYSIVLPTKM